MDENVDVHDVIDSVRTVQRFYAPTPGRLEMWEGTFQTRDAQAPVLPPPAAPHAHPLRIDSPLSREARVWHQTLPLGETGKILIHAPHLMLGYWHQPEEPTPAFHEIDGKRWLYTSDIGYLDEDGYLYIVDRKKDVIKPSGFQVWPREVKEAIASHLTAAEESVVGVPDERQGEAVKAFVVLQPGKTLTEAEGKKVNEDC